MEHIPGWHPTCPLKTGCPMVDFDKILFPVDFSDRSRAAVPFVEAFAEKFASELQLFHVVEPPFAEAFGPFEEARTDRQEAQLHVFQVLTPPHVTVTRKVVAGEPARCIVNHAHTSGTGLIMMPTHGYGAFRRFLIGSVAAKVLHDADCAVWTAAHFEELPQGADPVKEIVCAIDMDEKSHATVKNAATLAGRFGAKLTLVHAVPAMEARPHAYFDEQLKKYLLDMARQEIAKLLEAAGVEAQVCLHGGDIAKVVRYAAETHKANLVVIGRSSPGVMGRLRTHAYAIIRDSPCPVLSI
jgi:nucleotide-binding universal stress UspA family protein